MILAGLSKSFFDESLIVKEFLLMRVVISLYSKISLFYSLFVQFVFSNKTLKKSLTTLQIYKMIQYIYLSDMYKVILKNILICKML